MNNNYEDIKNLPHYEPKYHPRMSSYQRAAQFAPFAALTGYEELVRESSRLTDRKIELSEYERSILDEKLLLIQNNIKNRPEIIITYFIKDMKKSGGKYITITSNIKSVDLINRFIKLVSNQKILIDDIYDLKSELFLNINN